MMPPGAAPHNLAPASRAGSLSAMRTPILLAAASTLVMTPLAAQERSPAPADLASYAPTAASLRSPSPSELRDLVLRYSSDHDALGRRYGAPDSPSRRAALDAFDA